MTRQKTFLSGIWAATAGLLAAPSYAAAAEDIPIVGDAIGGWQMGLGRTENASDLPRTAIGDIIRNIMLWLLALVGVLAVIAFVIAGILYLTSAGDEDQIGRAKKTALWGLVGVVVALGGLLVVNAVHSMLGGSRTF